MILVTGGFGLIGSNLVKRLSEEGREVVLFDRQVNTESDFFKARENIHFVEGDVTNEFTLASLFKEYDIDAIVHCAANLDGKYCKANPVDAVKTNTVGTLSLLELSRIYGVKKFIYAGSGSVFGKQETKDPIYESTLATPMNTYASTKKMSEELIHMYRVNYGMDAVNVRVSWVFGPTPVLKEPRWNTPVAYYVWNVLAKNRLVEESGIDFIANYTYVDDVTNGLVLLLDKENAPEYVHLSSEELYSNKEIVEFLRAKSPESQIEIGEGVEPFVLQAPIRGPLVSEYKEQIGYEPQGNFKEALENYYEWMKQQLDKKEN